MPLLDHFHPPLSQRRHWESFHAAWTNAIVDWLNERLDGYYFAEAMIMVGGRVKMDVEMREETSWANREMRTSIAFGSMAWVPPAPAATMPLVFPDSFAVRVYTIDGGPTLVGAIELVSPGNKDRDENRQAFAIKCANYLHQGVGLVIVDIVTSRHANLHNVLIQLLGQSAAYRFHDNVNLYSVAYRPATRDDHAEIDMWQHPLELGQSLPTMPLSLKGASTIALDLDSTYEEVCRRRLG